MTGFEVEKILEVISFVRHSCHTDKAVERKPRTGQDIGCGISAPSIVWEKKLQKIQTREKLSAISLTSLDHCIDIYWLALLNILLHLKKCWEMSFKVLKVKFWNSGFWTLQFNTIVNWFVSLVDCLVCQGKTLSRLSCGRH